MKASFSAKQTLTSFPYLLSFFSLLATKCQTNYIRNPKRESDYGLVTREFESFVDDTIVTAVTTASEVAAAAAAAAAAAMAQQEIENTTANASSLSTSNHS
uniref:Uncharacterized protein n=1 Tax=Ditylum brightwellii TaxID=49249 RepID=A0A7S4VPL9_9STRA